ncbi:MAG: Sporulation initiation inhibitor protein Soj [Ignavibacteria bacterium]|nr:Sporulation initiation inhibitor protein Soj [Ignavibacteria bacterium]
MSKTISVCIPKGGVGKTTTAVNLSASLAVAEKKTLLVDVDPFGASAIALGFTPDKIKASLSEIFAFTHSIKSAIHRTELEYLDFVPSNIYSINVHDKFIKFAENRLILKNALREIEYYYDFIIIDCPPLLKGISTNALVASDSILIPIRSGHFSLEAVDRLFSYFEWIKEIANPKLEIEGIIMTMYEKDSKVTKISERELKLKYSKYLLNTVIPNTSLLNESTFYGKPLCLYKINSEGAAAYLELAGEILKNNYKKENILT